MWFAKHAERNLRPKTISDYRKLMGPINQRLGHMQLDKIRPTHILDLLNSIADAERQDTSYCCKIDLKKRLKKMGISKAAFSTQVNVSLTTLSTAFHKRPISKACALKICTGIGEEFEAVFDPSKPGNKVSPSTVLHYYHLISDILGAAVKWQYIPYNPCTNIELPKTDPSKIEYLDDEQTKKLIKLLQGESGVFRRPAVLLLLTGMRRGELLGLEWRDIDWKRRTIYIERTSQYIPGQGVFTGKTKNLTSTRIISIPNSAITILQEQLLWQQHQAKCLKNDWTDSGRIFTAENGKPMHPDQLTRWFSRFIKTTDLPRIHLHGLRHTYATLCIAYGSPITAVAAQLGHATVTTTTTIYAHAIKSAQIAASDRIDKLFDGIL